MQQIHIIQYFSTAGYWSQPNIQKLLKNKLKRQDHNQIAKRIDWLIFHLCDATLEYDTILLQLEL